MKIVHVDIAMKRASIKKEKTDATCSLFHLEGNN